jgi:hypothetical protein
MWDNLGQIETFNAGGPVEVPPSAEKPAPSAANRRRKSPATELSEVQLRALGALLSHPTVARAAAACHLSLRTIFRWLRDPKFRTALRKMQHDHISQAHSGLQGITAGAVETLREVRNNRKAPAGAVKTLREVRNNRKAPAGAVKTLSEARNNRKAPAGARASACRATLRRAHDLIQAGVIEHLRETLEGLKASSPQNND